MDALLQDVRYGVRQLLRQRGSSIVAVVTLALGIGVSTALFSVIDATMLHPLPYPNPEQLVTVSPEETMPDGRVSRATASMEDMRTWQQSTDVFSLVAGVGSEFRGRIVEGAEPERLQVEHFTEDFLPMHGVVPVAGRTFTRDDSDPGAPLVAMLGYGYWKSRFDGRDDVVGQPLRFDTEVATIVGVLPASFDVDAPIATPLRVTPDMYARRGTGRVSVYARLQPGITIAQARERLTARMQPRSLPNGQRTTNPTVSITSRLDSALGYYRTTIDVLAGAVALVLLIACVNVAGLLLARGAARQSELAVRASIGAGRSRLIRQLLTESLVLAAAGGAIGILLAWLSLDAIVSAIPLSMPDNSPVRLDARVLAAAIALLVPIALLFGLAPAIRLSRVQIGVVLARAGRQRGSALSRRGGQLLIALEVALAVVLVAGAGLMIRSFARLTAVDLGFSPGGLVVMQVLPLNQNPAVHQEYYDALLPQIRRIPGVASAGIVNNFQLGGAMTFSGVTIDGKSEGATIYQITPGYMEAIRAHVAGGRLPTDADYASRAHVALVNQMAADTLFAGHALGRQFTRSGDDPAPWTVIGVIQDLVPGGVFMSRREPQIFYPLQISRYDLNTAMSFVIRPSGDARGLADDLRRAAMATGTRALVERIRTGDELFSAGVVTPRRRTVLLTLLGGLGLTLALVGVFGMTAYAVTRRTSEIGVRMAFGARPAQMVRAMVRDSALPIGIGIALGIGAALLATQLIASFLFSTTPTDPATLVSVAIVLAITGCVAAVVPALRAAKIDPVSSLRAE